MRNCFGRPLSLLAAFCLLGAVWGLPSQGAAPPKPVAPPRPAAPKQPSLAWILDRLGPAGRQISLGLIAGAGSFASDINNKGEIVGSSGTVNPSGETGGRATLWTKDASGDYVPEDLGTLPGDPGSVALGINDQRQIVGSSGDATLGGAGIAHAVLWNDNGIRNLGSLDGGETNFAFSINNDTEIVGTSSSPDGNRAFLWRNGRMRDLGIVDKDLGSVALDINNHRDVVGTSVHRGGTTHTPLPSTHPFLWRAGKIRRLFKTGSDLFPVNVNLALGVNNKLEVVGAASVVKGHDQPGLFQAFLWRNDKVRILGTLPGDVSSVAFDINKQGQVVGTSFSAASDTEPRAFLWENGRFLDLGDLNSSDSDIAIALGINDKGQVVGLSAIGEVDKLGNPIFHAFLWQNGVMTDLGEL